MNEREREVAFRNKPFRREAKYSFDRDIVTRSLWALLLIAGGVLLFLDNIGLISIRVWDFWPLFPMLVGFSKLLNSRSLSERVWASSVIAFGVLFLLINLRILHVHTRDGSWPVALFFIAVGVVALVKTYERSRSSGNPGFDSEVLSSTNILNENVLFGGIVKRVEAADFAGGGINCVFGNVEVDLRRALMVPGKRSSTVDVHCVFGAVKIRVPESWQVNVQGWGVFGTFEDKIIPVRSPDIFESPALIVVGHSVFGSVEIEN